MGCCVVIAKGKLYNTMPFPPGTKQVSYVYYLKYDASQFAFDKLFDYDTEAFDLFVKSPGIGVASSGLKPVGDFQIGGERYPRYSVKGLKQYQRLEIEFSNLPRVRRNLRWPLTFVMALGLLFVVAYSLSKRRKGPGVPEEEAARDAQSNAKEELLRAVADLDDRYEQGNVPEAEYQRARLELKSKLKDLMARMDWKEEA
ncbi:MAG TPA: hypothetical protein EYP19_04580 [Desulfobacterales bacterium]|nr:hypothetical protein [Desulfobacterales bacterium]